MSVEWPKEMGIAALQSCLFTHVPIEGFRAMAVVEEDGDAVVHFHWKLDPTKYCVRLPIPNHDRQTPPYDTPTGWAETSAHWLMEELDTGGMRRAVRKHVADTVVLDFEVECSDAKRNFTISAVVPTEAGIAALISSGLVDVARAREQMNAGRLLSWLCAWADGTHRRVPIGHIAVSWLPNQECIAKLVFVQTVDGLDGEIRGEVVQSLLAAAHHQATEAGAVTRLFQDYELQNTDDA